MSRYTKYNSSYIIRKRHQNTNEGTIFYRDWVTIGGWDRFVPGKTPYYKDGNFVFTISNTNSYHKRHKYSLTEDTFTYDDVKNATAASNEVKVNMVSNDIRDFCYYGSCIELVRASIEDIINNFPSQITASYMSMGTTDNGKWNEYRYVKNPFGIDLYHKDVFIQDGMNPMRYLSYSYKSYTLDGSPITSYEIDNSRYDEIMSCPQNHQYEAAITITVNGGRTLMIYGIVIEREIVFIVSPSDANFVIKPNDETIEEFFNGLDGFERQLLNRDTKPLYKNIFVTPIEGNNHVKYVNREYIWPSNGYQIDIESPSYVQYVNGLIGIATYFDENETDNLYRCMTHEAIKNYDWTYTRYYDDDVEQDNIDGGNRVEQLLRIFGRRFDDIKREIDGIKFTNNVSYDGYNNQADALLSDKLNLLGWDCCSISPVVYNKDNPVSGINSPLTEETIKKLNINWYSAYGVEQVTPANMDIEFMRRMILNSKHILASKGTVEAIEMVMGMFGFGMDNNDFSIETEYREVAPWNASDVYDELVEINDNKDYVREYEDDVFSGVPLKELKISDGVDIIVPYYDHDKTYDGYLYFQSKGGWCHGIGDENDKYNETLNYLNVVSKISDLFDVNPNELNDGDIYYVVQIDDILDYEPSIQNPSHTFYVKDKYYSNQYTGWGNTASSDNEGIKKKAEYLENVVSTNIGNNPHTGYGNYDDGEEYFEYMSQPFKYAIDNNLFDNADEAEKKTFSIVKNNGEDNEKVRIVNNDDMTKSYYLNSKVVILTINISRIVGNAAETEEYLIKYFDEVILNYLLQVIPSTTILKLIYN